VIAPEDADDVVERARLIGHAAFRRPDMAVKWKLYFVVGVMIGAGLTNGRQSMGEWITRTRDVWRP
jgi:hypothetical protein